MPMYQLNPNLKNFWQTPSMYKRLKGGRFSSKTHDAAGMAVYLARNYSLDFLCLRMFQSRIADSVYTILVDKIYEAGWQDEFTINNNTITHNTQGSVFKFYGIARNISEIKGTEGIDICWIEEGEALTRDQWDIIDPTLRGENSELWLIYNPRLVSDFVETELPALLGDDLLTRTINYNENPFLSDTAKRKAAKLKLVDYDSYTHIYGGVPLSDDDKAIIKRSWVEAAIDSHISLNIDLSGHCHIGYDVADSGEDRNCAVRFNGAIATDLDAWKAGEDELEESTLRAYNHVAGGGTFAYDSIGVGAGVGSILKNKKKDEYYKFNAAADVFNPDREYSPKITNKKKFENLKAQSWQDVADRLRNTYNAVTKGMKFGPNELISISSDISQLEALKVELSTPHRDYSKRGLDMVESKKDVKKRLQKSHDLADAFIMAACPHLIKRNRKRFAIHG